MKRPLAYVTAAWSGNEYENTEAAARYCRQVYDAGYSPICPMLLTARFLHDAVPQEHKDGINYAKTREVYVAYRKAGYSKKFRAEHESEILLHQAAKKFFDESGLKKLPAIKDLQAEYTSLLTQKKSAYADFRKAREEMKELLTVKANVDRLMGFDKTEQNIEAEHRNER